MTKQELLTKLATECKTWGDAVEMGTKIEFACLMGGKAFNVGSLLEHEWLAERERLLNLQWEGVPKRYKFVATHADGQRWFFVNPPRLWEERGSWELAYGDNYGDYWEDENPPIAIPAGHDWKQSLETRPV